MSQPIMININSMRRKPCGAFVAQVVLNEQQQTLACRVTRVDSVIVELDKSSIYQYSSGTWQQTTLDDSELVTAIENEFAEIISNYGHLFVRDSNRDGKSFDMWRDSVIAAVVDKTDYTGHTLKVGNRIYTCYEKGQLASSSGDIAYKTIGVKNGGRGLFRLGSDAGITKRLQKQFDHAEEKRSRYLSKRPIGFDTWDQLQDFKKAAGYSTMNANQLRKFKGR